MKFSCRIGWHDWAAWVQGQTGPVTDPNGKTIGYYTLQSRACKNCHLMQVKKHTV